MRRGDLEMVEEYVQARSDRSGWKNDSSLLIVAIEKGYKDIALVLLAARSLSWEDDWAILDLARDKGLEEVAQEIITRSIQLIRAGTSCRGLSQKQMNCLFRYACREGDMQAVRNLIKSGCCVSILSKEEQEELLCHSFDVSRKLVHDIVVIQALLQKGAVDILSTEEQERLLLHACGRGDLIIVDALITNGCNVNCSNRNEGLFYSADIRSTPLMVAAREGHEEIVKKLILANAKVGMQDTDGLTALHYAAMNNNIQCGILLVEGGASVRTKSKYF